MEILKPIDAQHCSQLIENNRQEIIKKDCGIEIKKEWIGALSLAELRFLAQHCPSAHWPLVAAKETPTEILALLARARDFNTRRDVASNPSTSADTLVTLAKDEIDVVRRAVASNPKTPVGSLALLAKDKDSNVRKELAFNPNLPANLLALLARDGSEYVREGAAFGLAIGQMKEASNPKTSATVLSRLAESENIGVLKKVAANPNTPPDVLRRLASYTNSSSDESYQGVWQAVASNPSTPAEILINQAKTRYVWLYVEVVKNPNAPPEALKVILAKPIPDKEHGQDSEREIHKLAKSHPNYRPKRFWKSLFGKRAK